MKKYLFIFVFFISGAVLYFFYQDQLNPNLVPTINSFKEWERVENETWNYSFEYPKNVFFRCEYYKDDDIVTFFSKARYSECPESLGEGVTSEFNIMVAPKKENTSTTSNLKATEFLNIDGKQAQLFKFEVDSVFDGPKVTESDEYFFVDIELETDKILSVFWLSPDKEALLKILETFKFDQD